MDATTMDADAFKQPQSTQHPFPEHLPPRKFTQTWMQRNGFKAKTFFTLHYHSFSFRNRHGAREIWRRICMWIIMLVRLAFLAITITMSTFAFVWNTDGVVLLVFMAIVMLVLHFVTAWLLSLIADAAGVRRTMGFTVRRKGLDIFLYTMAAIELILCGTAILWSVFFILISVWVFMFLIYLIVGLMASAEPVDQYGTGVGV